MNGEVTASPTCVGVALDPGKPCEAALRYGAFLAAWHGAELVVLTAGSSEGSPAISLADVVQRLEELAAGFEVGPTSSSGGGSPRLRPVGREPRQRRAPANGAPGPFSVAGMLHAAAHAEGADFLVLPRGVCWAEGLYLMESVAERVILDATVPALVVPETRARATVGMRPTIVVPALAPATVGWCLTWAFSFADRLDGRVAVVPAADEPGAALVRLRRALGRLAPDLLILPVDERTVAGSRALSHVVAGLVRTAPCPVLVLPSTVPGVPARPGSRASLMTPGDPRASAESTTTSVRWHVRSSSVRRLREDSPGVGL